MQQNRFRIVLTLIICLHNFHSLSAQELAAPSREQGIDLRVLSYNIRRGYGTDGKTDLSRTSEVIRTLKPDLVGLQEVDRNVKRSGTLDQIKVLGMHLEMQPAFGKFMTLQGGEYGIGLLSRFPIQSVHALPLPVGNEPRVALVADVEISSQQQIKLITVHFDWVDDDTFRFAQAKAVKTYIETLKEPCLLVGDFNDEPESRTLKLFTDLMLEAPKPAEDQLTYSSTKPEVEIDFIFACPAARWKVLSTRVIDEPVVSDHRPVLAELKLLPETDQSSR